MSDMRRCKKSSDEDFLSEVSETKCVLGNSNLSSKTNGKNEWYVFMS